jgi:YVTN family beta-propeller protein
VHIIDPATNKVVGVVNGIEVGHGAAAAPDGRWLYVSNEANSTLDVVDARTLRVTSKVPLTGHPNNVSISHDGRRVYIAIREEPGAVDVVDTPTLTRVKSIPIEGAGHNTYVTPDGRYVIAGSVAGKTATAIDQRTEEPVWVMHFDLGVRPLAFEQNADGSTKRMFVQLTEFNGFAVVDFANTPKCRASSCRSCRPAKSPSTRAATRRTAWPCRPTTSVSSSTAA